MNCAPCITRLFSGHLACPVPEKGVSGTEYLFRTGKACFLHRMPLKMRRVPPGACFLHGAHIPYRRRPSPVPNSANARKEESIACTEYYKRQKGEGHCPEHGPECRREQENNSLRSQNTPANSTTTQRPTTVTSPANTPPGHKKKSRLNVTSIGTSEKRQLPTLPPGGAVPSALVSLTSLFGMGRGGSSPL